MDTVPVLVMLCPWARRYVTPDRPLDVVKDPTARESVPPPKLMVTSAYISDGTVRNVPAPVPLCPPLE